MIPTALTSSVEKVSALSRQKSREMYALMELHYEAMTQALFEDDLAKKDEVLLLHDGEGNLRGFTTLAWNPCGLLEQGDVIFSGDTVIDRECWGTQELVKGFCRRAGELKRQSSRNLYWFLISKGHRTYRYLSVFAKRFHPHPEVEEPFLDSLAGEVAGRMFGSEWKPSEGLIRFDESGGHLRREIDTMRDSNKWVDFFLKKNPSYACGDELVCMTEMAEGNLRKVALQAFKEGLEA